MLLIISAIEPRLHVGLGVIGVRGLGFRGLLTVEGLGGWDGLELRI